MEIDEGKKIIIFDETGEKKEFEILFTFHSDERNKDYVLFFDPKEPENVIPMIYHDDETLEEIEDEEEFAEVEEVLNAYEEDPKIAELKNK